MKRVLVVAAALLAMQPLSGTAQEAEPRSAAFAGPIKAALAEPVREHRAPRVELQLETTLADYCNYSTLDARQQRDHDTVTIVLRGVRRGLCLDPPGLSYGRIPLDLTPGHYVLAIRREMEIDHFAVEVSTMRLSLAVRGQPRFIVADTSTFWRPQPRTFLVSCGTPKVPELCADLRAWLARQPGVSRTPIPYQGRIGFRRLHGYWSTDYSLWAYDSDDALPSIRRCMGRVAALVAEAVGVGVHLQTAAGELMDALSGRSYSEKHIETPRRVTGRGGCQG